MNHKHTQSIRINQKHATHTYTRGELRVMQHNDAHGHIVTTTFADGILTQLLRQILGHVFVDLQVSVGAVTRVNNFDFDHGMMLLSRTTRTATVVRGGRLGRRSRARVELDLAS